MVGAGVLWRAVLSVEWARCQGWARVRGWRVFEGRGWG